MEIKQYNYNEIVNLLYKTLFDLERQYITAVNKGMITPNDNVFYEDEFKTALLTLESNCDLFKQYSREGRDFKTVSAALTEVYFSYYNVLYLYANFIPDKVKSLNEKVMLKSKYFYAEDKLYQYYQKITPISDRQYLFEVMANRLLIALKQPDKPYLFGLSPKIKYEMGKYYILNNKCDDGFCYTIHGFVKDEKHLNKLREIVMAKEPEKKEEQSRNQDDGMER